MSTRESSDVEQDKAEWEHDICEELEEMQEQADEEYQKKMETYTQELKLWKEQKQRKVCIGICEMYISLIIPILIIICTFLSCPMAITFQVVNVLIYQHFLYANETLKQQLHTEEISTISKSVEYK